MSCSNVFIALGQPDNLGDRKGGWREAGQGSGLPGPWLSWGQPVHHSYLQRTMALGHWDAVTIIPLTSCMQHCARHCPDTLSCTLPRTQGLDVSVELVIQIRDSR